MFEVPICQMMALRMALSVASVGMRTTSFSLEVFVQKALP